MRAAAFRDRMAAMKPRQTADLFTADGLPVFCRRSLRARTLKLTLKPARRLCLTLPLFFPKREALRFLDAHREWIQKHLARQPLPLTWRAGDSVSILGQTYEICHDSRLRSGVFAQQDKLMVSGDEAFVHRRVQDFIKRETHAYIAARVNSLAGEHALPRPSRITLRDTGSRWGSCSGKRALSFCWKLGAAPLFVLDYIVAHELAHLQEMNHGPRFWRLVGTLTDQRGNAEIWLRRHGGDLHAIP